MCVVEKNSRAGIEMDNNRKESLKIWNNIIIKLFKGSFTTSNPWDFRKEDFYDHTVYIRVWVVIAAVLALSHKNENRIVNTTNWN